MSNPGWMRIGTIALGAVVLAWVCAGVLRADDVEGARQTAETTEASAPGKLVDLAWIAGRWEGGDADNRLEEIWSEPKADAIMGVFRWVRGDKTWMYELLTLTAEGEDVFFRLRHFNSPALTPWEEKDGALTYKMVLLEKDKVVFENPQRDMPRRFIWLRTGPDTCTHRLEGTRDGKPVADEFRYRRVGG